jgi:transposase-like protein
MSASCQKLTFECVNCLSQRRHSFRARNGHLDEVFAKINGELCYIWCAVD